MLFTPIKPMLLQTGNEVIDDSNWIYDIKWDGWRILIHKEGERIEAFTRHGNNVTAKFPELQEVGHSIREHTAIIDCEGVVLRENVSNFDDFAYRGRLTDKYKIEQACHTHPATFIAFDVLSTDQLQTNKPLIERKKLLSSIIDPCNSLQVTPSVEGNGSHIFQLTKEWNMEGIVGKKRDSTYQINHRSNDWLKYKHFKMTETIILGYIEKPFSMLVGTKSKNGYNKVVANLEFGFKPEEKIAFKKIASQIIINKDRSGVVWIEPRLCCHVQYLERTENGLLRIASFKGFSLDKNPEEIAI